MPAREWAERTSWVLGACLLTLFFAARILAESARSEGVEVLRVARQARQTPRPDPVSSAAGPQVDQTDWSRKRLLAFAQSLTLPGNPEGVLRVPALQLEVPIFAGSTETNLDRGAAHIDGTAALASNGNAGIAGHRDGFFRKLKDIQLEGEVFIDLPDRTLRYRVVDISIVTPGDVAVLAPTHRPSLTLVTCYPFYFIGNAPQRFIVRAELADARTVASGGPADIF